MQPSDAAESPASTTGPQPIPKSSRPESPRHSGRLLAGAFMAGIASMTMITIVRPMLGESELFLPLTIAGIGTAALIGALVWFGSRPKR